VYRLYYVYELTEENMGYLNVCDCCGTTKFKVGDKIVRGIEYKCCLKCGLEDVKSEIKNQQSLKDHIKEELKCKEATLKVL